MQYVTWVVNVLKNYWSRAKKGVVELFFRRLNVDCYQFPPRNILSNNYMDISPYWQVVKHIISFFSSLGRKVM